MRRFLWFLIFIIFSCEVPPSDNLKTIKPDGSGEIYLSATKESYFSPLRVKIRCKYGRYDETTEIEIMNQKLDTTMCKMTWLDANNCQIVLQHTDGEKRIVNVKMDGDDLVIHSPKQP
ncbi:MAG: hypothetical protein NZ108_02805 [Bacteroidia bacterium]|nr:hypothetical protein [Bacteroidia bacterium]